MNNLNNQNKNQQNKKKGSILHSILVVVLVCVLFVVAYNIIINANKGQKLTNYQQVTTLIQEKKVKYIFIEGYYVRIVVRENSKVDFKDFDAFVDGNGEDFYFETNNLSNLIETIDSFNKKLAENEGGALTADQIKELTIQYNSISPTESWFSSIVPYLYFAAIVIFAFILIKSIMGANNKSIGFGTTKAKVETKSKVRFTDVAGAEEEKVELQEVVDFLKNPKKYTDLGARIPKGVLLVGPPGTGKTLIAKAVAGESNCSFFQISGSDFVEMFVGVGATRVRDLFDQAKKNAPCIVFIDEIDAVGRQRGTGLGGGNDEREQTLNQLLVEMDGFESQSGIIVIAATNRPDVLDPALLRPGRFDRQVYVHLPDIKGREAILQVHAKNKTFCDDVKLENIARITAGFSGADLENLLNEAAILAGRDNRPRITMTDINEAANKVMMGPQKKSRVVTERDRKITAYHESGHAILEKLLPNCDAVHEVSIIPRGMAGGYTMSRPETDDNYMTIGKLNDLICSYMGGRIAEEIIFKDISTGASNDIQQATKLARKMVTEFGMSERLGFINLSSDGEVFIGKDYQQTLTYSQETAKIIDEEIGKILQTNYNKAKKLLQDNIETLHQMAELLLKQETIYTEEVDAVMKKRPNTAILKKLRAKKKQELKKLEEEKEEKLRKEKERGNLIVQKAIEALKRDGYEIPENLLNQAQGINEKDQINAGVATIDKSTKKEFVKKQENDAVNSETKKEQTEKEEISTQSEQSVEKSTNKKGQTKNTKD